MSFQQGLSGLNAASKNLDVIGNNIANSGTYGAKGSRAEFSDVYAAALNGAGQNQIGIGTSLSTVAQQFTQGNITTTENPMDLAINGGGFFQVSDGTNPTRYSRNGQFKVSKDGFIVNNDGLKLMGYPANGAGVIQPGTAQPLQLPTGGIPPAVTSTVKMEFNLDSRLKVTAPSNGTATGMDLKDSTTYNNATSLTVYDAKGQDVAVTFYFQKSATNAAGEDVWNVYATANGTPFDTDATGAAIALDANGNPTTPYTTITFPATGGSPSAILGSSATPPGAITMPVPAGTSTRGNTTLAIPNIQLDLSGATENGSSFAVTNLTQDGYAPGQLTGIQVANNGIIQARYSNGQSKPAGQIELANFRNPQGLQTMGGNVWIRTVASGDAVVGVPGDGNMGSLQSGALEESNVDITAELVNMVTAQRAYQASAQTIKTQDQVLQTIVNLR
ncbi:flagellar hook protein FlgE [Roseateles puraquae]|jgi:flagellar hook protein FlgE|uniref:Flagellar hook protein FlgE n=1 Tax=Roseateles puraquae TaxID=431059 RepID=A0A254NDU3_9BURK|nr:flagellar hook protein FlgE [Roseateles puraquae]MDG0855195.1 flagellar hook protein FlgE [Roseateles puraquae]OWR05804.1 flagellar hook protein FlgE [Roseateles puraquae]GHU55907.1 flagellar hook protein FlgE [Spirochaetia bacterium]